MAAITGYPGRCRTSMQHSCHAQGHNKRNTCEIPCKLLSLDSSKVSHCGLLCYVTPTFQGNMSQHLNAVVSSCLCTCCDSDSDGLGISCAPAVTTGRGVQMQTSQPHVQCGMWAWPSGCSCSCWRWRCLQMSEEAAWLHDNRNEHKLGIKSI